MAVPSLPPASGRIVSMRRNRGARPGTRLAGTSKAAFTWGEGGLLTGGAGAAKSLKAGELDFLSECVPLPG